MLAQPISYRDWFRPAYLDYGRMAVALNGVESRAQERGIQAITDIIDRARPYLREWQTVWRQWNNQGDARVAATAVDRRIDRQVKGIYSNLMPLTERPAGDPLGDEARLIFNEHFSQGLAAVTQVVMEQQLVKCQALLADLQAAAGRPGRLRCAAWVEDLAADLPAYAEALNLRQRTTWGEVIARRDLAYEAMCTVVAQAFVSLWGDSETLTHVLAPLKDQLDRAAVARKRAMAGANGATDEDAVAALEGQPLPEVEGDIDGDGIADGPAAEAPGDAGPAALGPAEVEAEAPGPEPVDVGGAMEPPMGGAENGASDEPQREGAGDGSLPVG